MKKKVLTWGEKFARFKEADEFFKVEMNAVNNFIVHSRLEITDGRFATGVCGWGKTPALAINEAWKKCVNIGKRELISKRDLNSGTRKFYVIAGNRFVKSPMCF